jgi:hypothetical protein
MPDASPAVPEQGAFDPRTILEALREQLALAGTRPHRAPRRAAISIPKLPPVQRRFAIVWASLVLWVLYVLHGRAEPVPEETIYSFYTLEALRQKVFETDWVTPAIVWTFLFGCFYLVGIVLTKRKLLAAAEGTEHYTAVMNDQLERVKGSLLDSKNPGALGYYGARLHALVVRWETDADLPAVQALKNEIVEIDEQDVAHSFVTVGWCETALPLLGFLGTVIGIGAAIGSISEAIKLLLKPTGSGGQASLDTMFNLGFQNMALAFDTTFFGLFLLLVLGVLHILVKKSLANRFDNARRFYSLALAQMPEGHQNVLVLGLSELRERMDSVEETLRSIDEDATAYKSRVERLVDHVIMEGGDQFKAIRKALMKPVIEFERVEKEPQDGFVNFVATHTKTQRWRLGGLGLTAGANVGGVASVFDSRSDKAWLATFRGRLDENNQINESRARLKHVYPNDDVSAFVAQDYDDQIWFGALASAETSASSAVGPRTQAKAIPPANLTKVPTALDRDLPVLADDGNRVLLPVRIGADIDIQSLAIAAGAQPSRLLRLPAAYDWKEWDFNRTTRTLLAVGHPIGNANGAWSLVFYSVPAASQAKKGSERSEPSEIRQIGRLVLPSGVQPRCVRAVDTTSCLFTITDSLHYIDETRTTPKKVESQGIPTAITNIVPNRHGWVALLEGDRLSMWSCRKGGRLYPYDDSSKTFKIEAVQPELFRVSADGRHLYGADGHSLFKWSFPKSMSDRS